MKPIFILFLLSISLSLAAQTPFPGNVTRTVRFRTIGKDSIDLSLNADYEMIEDSCTFMVRHGHINLRERKFFGKFTDVSKLDPSLILSEGNYTTDGLKDGLFISHYPNGNLRSKGIYKNNKYDGRWEAYYEDSKPALTFQASNDTIRIIDAWNEKGKKIIDNGKGTYEANVGTLTWKGKLDNGKPDGTWHLYKTTDATQTSLADESFKKGVFQKGNSPIKSYTDASRILLVDPDMFPFAHAEAMHVSVVPCNGTKRKVIVNAQYSNGLPAFTQYIQDLSRPAMSRFNLANYHNTLVLSGDISEKGEVTHLKSVGPFDDALARAIIIELMKLPLLQPATVDKKPATQGITISYTFNNGSYTLSYRFLQIKAN